MSTRNPAWIEDAVCRDYPPEWWETPNPGQPTRINQAAVAICRACPVREQCLTMALRAEASGEARHHVYGGMLPRQRAALGVRG